MLRSAGLELAATSKILSVTTDGATGTNYVQLADQNCAQVIIYNDSGVSLRVAYCDPVTGADRAGETYLVVPTGVAQPLRGISNTKQVKLRRDDGSTTQVTIRYVMEGVR